MDPRSPAEAVAEHLKKHVPWGAHITVEILEANRGFETDPEKPAATLLGMFVCFLDGVLLCHPGWSAVA